MASRRRQLSATRRIVLGSLAVALAATAVAIGASLGRAGGGDQPRVANVPDELREIEPGMTRGEVHRLLGEPRSRYGRAEAVECWLYDLPAPREYRFCFRDGELIQTSTH